MNRQPWQRHWQQVGYGSGAAIALLLATLAPANAAVSPTPPSQGLGRIGASVELAQVRLRLGSRPSRFRVGGFRRSGTCLVADQEVVPLVPPAAPGQLSEDEVPVDLTTSATPIIWVYVPAMDGARTAQFTLQDEMGTAELVNTTFELSGEAGIVGIPTAAVAELSLEAGELYYWQMAVDCGTTSAEGNPVVSGWLSRTTLENSPTGTLAQQASVYAANGIWQDALSALALARYAEPTNSTISAEWRSLMESAGLDTFATTPVVQMVD